MRNSLAPVVLVPLLLLASSGRAAAQNDGNPTILTAVKDVQSSLKDLKSALDAIQTSIDDISEGASVNTRFTPPVDIASPDLASCVGVNISSEPKTIQVQIINLSGVVAETFPAAVVLPGRGTGGGNRSGDFYYCKFTVVDGTKADIRGAMSVCTNTACKQTVAAE